MVLPEINPPFRSVATVCRESVLCILLLKAPARKKTGPACEIGGPVANSESL
jgi:hypothetical protein